MRPHDCIQFVAVVFSSTFIVVRILFILMFLFSFHLRSGSFYKNLRSESAYTNMNDREIVKWRYTPHRIVKHCVSQLKQNCFVHFRDGNNRFRSAFLNVQMNIQSEVHTT